MFLEPSGPNTDRVQARRRLAHNRRVVWTGDVAETRKPKGSWCGIPNKVGVVSSQSHTRLVPVPALITKYSVQEMTCLTRGAGLDGGVVAVPPLSALDCFEWFATASKGLGAQKKREQNGLDRVMGTRLSGRWHSGGFDTVRLPQTAGSSLSHSVSARHAV
jgi:hypothetical protein